MTEEVVARLRAAVRGLVSTGVSLAPATTLRVGGRAAVLVEPVGEADLVAAARIASEAGVPVLALGRGSNVLVSDEGFPGVVLRLGRGFDWIRAVPADAAEASDAAAHTGAGRAALDAGGATPLGKLANWAARRGLSGLEFAVAIPASLGGAVRMNAGAHGASFAEVLVWARVYRLGAPEPEVLPATALGMGYRSTGLGASDIVCAARLHLGPGVPAEILARMQQYREHRAATQPAEPRNAGSMFRNPAPPAPSAGRLIEEAGLKGFRVGAAQVSPRHANFFVAGEGATASDVYGLLMSVREQVRARSGILLEPEVRLIGDFGR